MSWVRIIAYMREVWSSLFPNREEVPDWGADRLTQQSLLVLINQIHHVRPRGESRFLNHNLIFNHRHYRRVVIEMPNEVQCYSVDMCRVAKYSLLPASTAPPLVYTDRGLVDGAHRLYAARHRGDTQLTLFIPHNMHLSEIKL